MASRAQYFRDYRRTVKPTKERIAHSEGVREGIALCVKFCREILAGHAYTGFQTAVMIEKGMVGAETPEMKARREMVARMGGGESGVTS